MLRDARGTGAQGVTARGDGKGKGETSHTSRSRSARIAQHEDDWERVSNRFFLVVVCWFILFLYLMQVKRD